MGGSKQPERGSSWMHGLPENTMGQLLGPQQGFPGQAGPSSQLARPPSSVKLFYSFPIPFPPDLSTNLGSITQTLVILQLSPEMEKALLQQVMSLTPEQINMLPAEQRNQVLQLQQILRH